MPELAELSEKLTDKPLEDSSLFVNRKKELVALSKIASMYRGTLVGIVGERGIGKTTFFNLYSPPEGQKIFVRIMNRDSIESIFADLCYGLSRSLGEKYLGLLESTEPQFSANVGVTPGITATLSRHKAQFQQAVHELRALLDKEGKIVIILDEIDKENVEEILRILDALKYAFEGGNTTVLVALPPPLYKKYLQSRSVPDRTHNLENVFSYMVMLGPLEAADLKKMVSLRTGKLSGMVDGNALDAALAFACGNPRQVLSVLKEATLTATEKITAMDVKKTVRKYLAMYLEGLSLTTKDLAVVRCFDPSKDSFLANIRKKRIFPQVTSAYVYLKRLAGKQVFSVEKDTVNMHPRFRLAREYGLI